MQATNQKAKQILRVLLEPDMAMQIELRVSGSGPQTEPKLWGIVLADVIRHLARACAQEYGLDQCPVLDLQHEVHQALTEELASDPPSETGGGVIRGGPGG
jgi:hypothetical protein